MFWLLKTEPTDYSWHDLWAEGETVWDGIGAPKALKNLSFMKPGDGVFIYHSGRERSIIGVGEVTSLPYGQSGANKRGMVIRIVPRFPLSRPVKLREIKKSGLFSHGELVRLPRLSVVSISKEEWDWVMEQGVPGKE